MGRVMLKAKHQSGDHRQPHCRWAMQWRGLQCIGGNYEIEIPWGWVICEMGLTKLVERLSVVDEVKKKEGEVKENSPQALVKYLR